MYLIAKGYVSIMNESCEEVELLTYGPGSFFGGEFLIQENQPKKFM